MRLLLFSLFLPFRICLITLLIFFAFGASSIFLIIFFLIVFATFFVMMSAFSAKLQVYLLPGFGFLTYAAVLLWKQQRDARETASTPESC